MFCYDYFKIRLKYYKKNKKELFYKYFVFDFYFVYLICNDI